MLEQIMEYSLRILPGILLLIGAYILLPKNSLESRFFILVLGFILIRDAMTPLGFWRFGVTGNTVWMRFLNDGWILFTLGLVSLLLTLLIVILNKSLQSLLFWCSERRFVSIFAGLLGTLIVVIPLVLIYSFISIEHRGGTVSTSILLPLLFMALAGNFMEEVLFRGYIQGYFERIAGPWKATIISAFLFATGHIFLASTVTDLGVTLLVFTLYEGMVCAFIRMKYGILPSTLTHGLTIFLLASGLI
ncbi:CPBP family intramembrane glutamic endopeptidase [Paenibacillus lautus]|uniref:CPBP family intramembrane metalloprotease n=1 Tax=Paenibacillus lautus TaxID=1401 RepID=A0A385TIS6_PAELA|nr:CPBP family intramembrane glutamic endopeptidase [Paenibacillus lautus]AYB44410.1 CPBP family intramembrane metalloprotease [Paenibacillus lautus]